jgi:hypothetical protein
MFRNINDKSLLQPINDIENSTGLYINTLPLIVDHETQKSRSIIESIKVN